MKSTKRFMLIFILILLCVSISMLSYRLSPPIVRAYLDAVIDEQTCIPSKAKKMGVPANRSSIRDHILSLLNPGMRRDEVNEVLKSIAPIEIGSVIIDNDSYSEEVFVELCGDNPWNNIILRTVYSKDGILLRVYDVYQE